MPHITETITEALCGSHKVDREANVIRGVKLIGFESRNNRSYSPDALKSAVNLYEGAKVNLDHVEKPGRARTVTERIGVIRGANYVEGQGVFGDFHYNPKHVHAEQILWDAEHNPAATGFSHHAVLRVGDRRDGKDVVEAIVAVKSVDLVADPATTSGIFEGVEGVIADQLMADEKRKELCGVVDVAIGLIRNELYNRELNVDQCKALIATVATDLLKELQAPTVDPATAADAGTPATGDTSSESQDSHDSLTAEITSLRNQLRQREFTAAVESELTAAGLTPTDEAIVPPVFRKTLLATESADDRAALIADRKILLGGKKPAAAKATTTVSEAADALTPERFLSRLRGR